MIHKYRPSFRDRDVRMVAKCLEAVDARARFTANIREATTKLGASTDALRR